MVLLGLFLLAAPPQISDHADRNAAFHWELQSGGLLRADVSRGVRPVVPIALQLEYSEALPFVFGVRTGLSFEPTGGEILTDLSVFEEVRLANVELGGGLSGGLIWRDSPLATGGIVSNLGFLWKHFAIRLTVENGLIFSATPTFYTQLGASVGYRF